MGKGSCNASMVSLRTVQINWNVLAYLMPKSRLLSTTRENHRLVLIGFTMYSLLSTSTVSWNHVPFPPVSSISHSPWNLPQNLVFPSLVYHPATYLSTLSGASNLLHHRSNRPLDRKVFDFLPPNLQIVFPAGPSSPFFPVTMGERIFPLPGLRIPGASPTFSVL